MTRIAALLPVLALARITGRASRRATPRPRLKSQATVSSDIVRIGDLVENAGAAADTPIFRAPDLGQTGAVPVTRRARRGTALRARSRVDTRGLSEVVGDAREPHDRGRRRSSSASRGADRALCVRQAEESESHVRSRRARRSSLSRCGSASSALARISYESGARPLRCDASSLRAAAHVMALHRHGGRDNRSRRADARACARRTDQGERLCDRAPPEERVRQRAAGLRRRRSSASRRADPCAPASRCATPT